MDPSSFLQSPFAPLTFVVAPALLTNASSVLAMSAVNRVMRAHDRWTTFSRNRKQGRGGFSARTSKRRHIALERAHLCRGLIRE
jgi:hypothetical protein